LDVEQWNYIFGKSFANVVTNSDFSGLLMTNIRQIFFTLAVCASISLVAAPASAGLLTFNYDNEFSGGTAPEGPDPWLTAVFNDDPDGNGTVDTAVQLTLSGSGLTDAEFVSEWYFNLNPAYDPTLLTFSDVDVSDVGSVSVQTGLDAFKADGDGKYDFLFTISTAPPGDRFIAGDTLVFDIGGIGGLTALDFNYLSAPDGGHGPFLSAAHVQGIGPSNGLSGWINPTTGDIPDITEVPEPASLLLLASGIAAGGRHLRKRNRKQ
jgi:hypothetical protein